MNHTTGPGGRCADWPVTPGPIGTPHRTGRGGQTRGVAGTGIEPLPGAGPRAAVVGVSIGGLTAALVLRSIGCEVDVYERASAPLSRPRMVVPLLGGVRKT